MADDDEFVTDEQLAIELDENMELELDYQVIPMGLKIAYTRLSKCSRTIIPRLENLTMLLLSSELVQPDDIDFEVHEFVRAEIADIKISIVRRRMVTDESAGFIQFMEEVMDMHEDSERQGKASEMLAQFKASGGDIHTFYKNLTHSKANPVSPKKDCAVCMSADPVANFSEVCTHPLSLCSDCLFQVKDACPICRATVPDKSEAPELASAPGPPPNHTADD
jgi:hypothetical protein